MRVKDLQYPGKLKISCFCFCSQKVVFFSGWRLRFSWAVFMVIVKVALQGCYKHRCRCIIAVQSVEIAFKNSHWEMFWTESIVIDIFWSPANTHATFLLCLWWCRYIFRSHCFVFYSNRTAISAFVCVCFTCTVPLVCFCPVRMQNPAFICSSQRPVKSWETAAPTVTH